MFKLYASASKYNLVFISYGRIESNKCVTNGEKRIKSEKKTETSKMKVTPQLVMYCAAAQIVLTTIGFILYKRP